MSATLPLAERIGKTLARKLFAARGNNSEIHLIEDDLATLLVGAAQIALENPVLAAVSLPGTAPAVLTNQTVRELIDAEAGASAPPGETQRSVTDSIDVKPQ